MEQTPKAVTWIVQAYGCLLRLYPALFRSHYETEILQVFATCCRARYHTGGRWGVAAFAWHTLVDLLATAGQEWWRAWRYAGPERNGLMLRSIDEYRPFMEEVTTVLDRQPDYYQLFVTQIESLQSVGTVADCLALEGDLADPVALFALFQEAGDGTPTTTPRWLARLCAAVRQSLHDVSTGPAATVTSKLIERIYANPTLFELIAAAEVGQQLVDVVESLALDGDIDEIDDMLALMQQLGDQVQNPA
ncbi:MAG: hypothetical protein R3C14_47515 [Caldilineaceae bacterium]